MKRILIVLSACLMFGLLDAGQAIGQIEPQVSISRVDVSEISSDKLEKAFADEKSVIEAIQEAKPNSIFYAITVRLNIDGTAVGDLDNTTKITEAKVTVKFMQEDPASVHIVTWLPDTIDESLDEQTRRKIAVEAAVTMSNLGVKLPIPISPSAKAGAEWEKIAKYVAIYRRVYVNQPSPFNNTNIWTFRSSDVNPILPGLSFLTAIIGVPKGTNGSGFASTSCKFLYPVSLRNLWGVLDRSGNCTESSQKFKLQSSDMAAKPMDTPTFTPVATETLTPKPQATLTPDKVAGYYHGAGFGVAINYLQDGIYYLESDPGTWGFTGCGMPWEDKIFAVGKTTNPTSAGLAYMIYMRPVGDRTLLDMIYFTHDDGNLAEDALQGIRIDRHEFEDTVPGNTLSGQYPGGVSIRPIKNNIYYIESNTSPWGYKGCGIASGNRIFGVARSTHPEGHGLTYTLHIQLDEMKLKVNLIYFIDYQGELIYLPSTIRVDPHELER